jgi:hypothetical protein
MCNEQNNKWSESMQDEIKSMYEMISFAKVQENTQEQVVAQSEDVRTQLTSKIQGTLVVKGFRENMGIDFDEIFSLVIRMSLNQVALCIAATMNLEIEQLDVETVLLHGDLEEEITWSIYKDSWLQERSTKCAIEEELVFLKTSSLTVVQEVQVIHD